MKEQAQTNKLMVINDAYLQLQGINSRHLLIYGGAGSGKSYYVAQREILKCISSPVPIRLLYGRKYYKHVTQSQFPLLQSVINNLQLNAFFKINRSVMTITFLPTGSELIAIGMDDPEKIKSIFDPVSAWIEEATELTEEDADQLNLRLRVQNTNLQITYSFNPISKNHWLKKRFFPEDLTVPFATPVTTKTTVGDEFVETTIFKTNYTHNLFIDATYKTVLESYRSIDPVKYQVYVDAEWGDLKEGLLFKREFLQTYSTVPNDARGVVYCDPNLSQKSKGDTTAIVRLLYSPSLGKYLIDDVICRSFSNSDDLLNNIFAMRNQAATTIGMDGNFGQEATWSQFMVHWTRQHNMPYPVVEFKRYAVDRLAKNASYLWASGMILVNERLLRTADGQEALSQIHGFSGKTAKKKDDAPDALICGVELTVELGYNNRFAIDIKNFTG